MKTHSIASRIWLVTMLAATFTLASLLHGQADRFFNFAAGNPMWDNDITQNWGIDPGGPYNTAIFEALNVGQFEGSGGNVSIAASGVSANGIVFAANGYKIMGGTLSLGTPDDGPAVTVNLGVSASINSNLARAGSGVDMRKEGAGTLVLRGDTEFSGSFHGVHVNRGMLVLGSGSIDLTSGGALMVAGTNSLSATMHVAGGTLTLGGRDLVVGQGYFSHGIFNQTNGTVNFNAGWTGIGNYSTGEVNLSGGLFNSEARSFYLGVRGSSSLNVSGDADARVSGLVILHSAPVTGAGKTGTVNLDGGALQAAFISTGTTESTSIFNFNGGTLKPAAAHSNFMAGLNRANVRDGGARIDTNGHNITIAQPLEHSDIDGDALTDGGLTKDGTGTLILNGPCGHTGATSVNGGTLQVGHSLTASPTVMVAAGATLAGSGTLLGSVNSAGTIAPGAGIRTLILGGLSLGGTYECEVDGAVTDGLVVAGDIDLTGARLVVSVLNGVDLTHPATILSYYGSAVGNFRETVLPDGYSIEHDTTAKEIRLLLEISDFDTWASTHGVTGGPADDDDHDGLTNYQEYVFGLHPNSGASVNPIAAPPDKAAKTFSYTRRAVSLTGLSYSVWFSTDLANWTKDRSATEGVPVLHGEVETVEVTLSTLPGDPLPAKLFIQVRSSVYEGFALIPAGWFQMGDTLDGDSDAPPVNVYVSGFHMEEYQVTKELWDAVREWGLNNGYTDLPAGSGKAGNHPVHSITWHAMAKWCNARSEKEGLVPCYTVGEAIYKTGESVPECNWSGKGYRLPSEAEWEKAARGRVAGLRFPWGDTIDHSQANYRVYSSDGITNYYSYDHTPRPPGIVKDYYLPTYNDWISPYTSPVGSFAANDYGLHDMVGNVWERCWDFYSETSYMEGASDPLGPNTGSERVYRGGGWQSNAQYCRSACRFSSPTNSSYYNVGFRVARSSVP